MSHEQILKEDLSNYPVSFVWRPYLQQSGIPLPACWGVRFNNCPHAFQGEFDNDTDHLEEIPDEQFERLRKKLKVNMAHYAQHLKGCKEGSSNYGNR